AKNKIRLPKKPFLVTLNNANWKPYNTKTSTSLNSSNRKDNMEATDKKRPNETGGY
ncbi:hypothetical protein TRIATDRAFT_254902, partial [Trichoderma atroviride IMI 206040]